MITGLIDNGVGVSGLLLSTESLGQKAKRRKRKREKRKEIKEPSAQNVLSLYFNPIGFETDT